MLIIVESPSKAKTISSIVGKNHTVKASVGHIRAISDDKKTTDGRKLEINGIDIEKGFKPIYEVDPAKNDVVKELKKIAKSAKDGILFATDEDREGEAISWHLAEVLEIDPKSIQRLVFHEITKKAILEAMKRPRPLNIELVTAQKARQVLDKLVGYKLSPVLWKVMNNNRLSAGRVQSPALRLVCEREDEIKAFVPQEYWEIFGKFTQGKSQSDYKEEIVLNEDETKANIKKEVDEQGFLKMTASKGKKLPKEIVNQEEVKKFIEDLTNNREFRVSKVSEKQEFSKTKPPFTTSTLQQAASSRLGMTPKQTMRIAQKLYEGVQIDGKPTALITYMRTDSVNLSQEAVNSTRDFISKKYSEFLPVKSKFYSSKSRNAQEAHEAIRPVDVYLHPEKLKGSLDNTQWKLYDLIWKRMVACQMTDEIRQRYSFELENELKDTFSGSIAWTTSPGFKLVWDPNSIKEKPKADFEMKEGTVFSLDKLVQIQNFTSPPSRYSPASLIKKLEELGIGRPSTYASIISTLNDRTYTETVKNIIYPTILGQQVNKLLTDKFTKVTSSDLTAQMEEHLDCIARGEEEYEKVLQDFWAEFRNLVEKETPKLDEDKSKYQTIETDVKDPKYGDVMVLKMGRFGEYYQNPKHPEVMYPKNFREIEVAQKEANEKFGDQVKDRKCTECGKDLVIKISKSTLNPYIACPDYRVGNKHTVDSINYGKCPKCQKEGRQGYLTLKSYKGRKFYACNLDKKICGYTENVKIEKKEKV